MHDPVKNKVSDWYQRNRVRIDGSMIADLGAYDINGSVRQIIPHVVGFDIYSGKGVDVVVVPGQIPFEHRNRYDFVVTVSAFQFCPNSLAFKFEILDLLKDGGELFLTMCSVKCKYLHSTSPNIYNFADGVRMTESEIISFMGPEIEALDCHVADVGEFSDLFFWGKKIPPHQRARW